MSRPGLLYLWLVVSLLVPPTRLVIVGIPLSWAWYLIICGSSSWLSVSRSHVQSTWSKQHTAPGPSSDIYALPQRTGDHLRAFPPGDRVGSRAAPCSYPPPPPSPPTPELAPPSISYWRPRSTRHICEKADSYCVPPPVSAAPSP